MNPKPSVSAIVVTWNSSKDIYKCLESLLSQDYLINEIFVVDNHSSDDTLSIVKTSFPQVELISLNENVGFAKGNNIALKRANSDWCLLLNPDAYLAPNWLNILIKHIQHSPKTGMLGGLLLNVDDPSKIDSYGIDIFQSLRVVDAGIGKSVDDAPTSINKVFGVCAAAVLLSKEMLNDIAINGEYFPERFFCYYEDADLCWRAWRKDWDAFVVPSALGYHKRGASPTGSHFSRYLTHRNRWFMLFRNAKLSEIIFQGGISVVLHEILMLLRTLRHPSLFKATLEGLYGINKSISEYKKLPTKSVSSLPLKNGVGFKIK